MEHEVANTILQQMGGAGRIHAMTGATIILHDDGVGFKLKRGAKVNYVFVRYDRGPDTYTMQFGNVRGFDFKVKSEVDGLYADGLKRTFEEETGLYLSL